MASKVIVKLPVAPFGQVNKSKTGALSNEIVLTKPPETAKDEDLPSSSKIFEQVRLEQNVKFLQDQHQLMLSGLHGEIEKLKARNRELQFQLVFGKGPVPLSSPSPSSPEDDTKHKLYTSPKLVMNTTPLQVELLEKEIGELKLQLEESDSRNVYLSAMVDEQKKKLERYDRRREKEREQRVTGQAEEVELMRKLEDAETLVRRLRRENSDLRRESVQQSSSETTTQQGQQSGQYTEQQGAHTHQNQHYTRDNNSYQSARGQGGHRGGGRSHRGNGHNNGHYNRGGWFPPLHSQSFWQGGRQHNDRTHTNTSQENGTNLPNIPMNDGGTASQHHQQSQQYHGHGRKGSNNNHYHNGDGRKYRGHNKGNKPS